MRIAVMADAADQSARVPDAFETSKAMLIFSEENLFEIRTEPSPDKYAQAVIGANCEAVVCGPHIGQEVFDPMAYAGITRFNGEALPVSEAYRLARTNDLPYITEYEGGPGCSDGHGSCDDGDC